MNISIKFEDLRADEPKIDALTEQYAQLRAQLAEAGTPQEKAAVLGSWDLIRRETDTWGALTSLRFYQDTTDPERKAGRERVDELRPQIEKLDTELKQALLDDSMREALEAHVGAQAFALWAADARTFDPSIQELLVEEAKLCGEYTELRSSAKITFRGEEYSLAAIGKFTSDKDRETRYAANQARWAWFEENGDAFDDLYDQLVKLRTRIAKALGYDSFEGLGYDRMHRLDYGKGEVETFRDEVRRVLVPLVAELREAQAERLGIERVMSWDEGVHDLAGNPVPGGDHDWMVEQAHQIFEAISPELAEFYRMMVDKNLLDLDMRDGKAGGGFCTAFPSTGLPFIFANFNQTEHDATVFTHEMGHAFQVWMSRDQPLHDYLWPTLESCEIHSMSLEYLTAPSMEAFFGDDAERFRRIHLLSNLFFLPYGCAIDHFQHLVYANPEATPAERRAFWREMERLYLPTRDYGDLPHVGTGGLWHGQLHVFEAPFYYIDYTLAETCALQFWTRSQEDFEGAVADYIELCKRGGSLPFRALAESAGLISPFEPGCLNTVVDAARDALGLR